MRAGELFRRTVLAGAVVIAGSACVDGQDDPTWVKDLRVVSMAFEAPEVMITGCNIGVYAALASSLPTDGGVPTVDPRLQQVLTAAAAVPTRFSVLIVDPRSPTRELRYRLTACANVNDRKCNFTGDFVEVASGTTTPGLLEVDVALGGLLLPDGEPLLLEVLSQDRYRGLGGIRVPVVLSLFAPDVEEQIYAQKLMVYTCPFFPTMKANATPRLSGAKLGERPWGEGEVLEVQGKGPFVLTPDDFAGREEAYVVPSLSLKPLELTESWRIAWHSTHGTMSSYETGGTLLDGVEGRHRVEWLPDQKATTASLVDFWMVVRDGRGGQSYLHRQARWSP